MNGQKISILKVERFAKTETATFSRILLNNEFLCLGLENTIRDKKIAKITAIDAGTYPLKLRTWGGFHNRYAKRFAKIHKGMLEITNVPNFTDILFHIGNFPKDTDGCILVGKGFSTEANMIFDSIHAYKDFYVKVLEELEANAIWVDVVNVFEEKEAA